VLCGQQWVTVHKEGKLLRWKQHRSGQLILDHFYPQPTNNNNTNTKKYKRIQLLLLNLSGSGDQFLCLGHTDESLPKDLSPSLVTRNYTVTVYSNTIQSCLSTANTFIEKPLW
jgi:hypothetical protein